MNKKVKTKLKKMLSLFVLNCFLLSYVYGPALANITDGKAMVEKYKNIFNEFMLPYSYGQIIKSHYAGTDRVVINIQDLHCHPKVQKNISNIIELFDKRYGIANIYLEGAYGDVDTQWLLQAVKGDRETADKILQTGRLTGAEYYSAVSGKTTIIKGLEQKDAYFDNLKRFAFIVENQDKINLILEGIKESTKKLKENYYSKRQYRLERLSDSYRKGKISPEKYYILLNKHIDRLGIDIYKYKHTFRYMTLIGLQKELDYKAIGTDLQNFMLLLKEHLSPDLYKMLSDSTDEFSKADKLYGYIRKIARQYDLNLDVNYKNLNKYFKYLELSQQINPFKLVAEEQELSREINTRFSETKAQREAVFLIYFERYLRDYLNSKITVEDYEYYKENIDTYIELWNKYVDNRVLSLLDKYIDEADIFYAINNDRNTYFANNISNGIETSAIEGKKDAEDDTGKIMENIGEVKRIDIIITGGFHTDTVSDILEEKGISYIVITPNVTEGAKKAEDIYYAIAKEQGKISFQTLATLPLSLYGQDVRVRVSVESFGRSVSEKIFGERLVRDVLAKNSPMTQELTAELSQAAQKRQIEFAKILDSDDYGDIDEKITALIKESVSEEHKNKVTRELLEKAKPEDIEKALSAGQKELEALIDLLSETNPIKRLVLSLKFILPDLKLLFGSPEKDFNNLINRYAFITNVKTGRFEMLRFTQTGVYKIINRMDIPVSKSEIDSMGLEIAFDDKGNITNVTAKEGFELSSLLFDGEPQADEKYNLSFTDAQMQAMVQDSGAKGQVDIYLDDDEEVLAKNIADAIRTNSLMVIHIFRKGYNSKSLTLSQLYDRYQKAYSLLQSDKLKLAFPKIEEYEKSMERDTTITSDFFLKELLKNHFAHGNHGLFEQPIACYIETNDEGQISEIITYDAGFGVESSWRNTAETLMNSATIFGDHKAHEYMGRSILRNLTRGEVSLNGIKFFKAKSTLRTREEQMKALSDYDKYLESLSRRTQQDDWNDFWGLQTEDTVSRLYNRGYAKYLRQYLKQTGKPVENLTEEESAEISQKAENYRFTLQGLAYGAFLEIFALWNQDFIDSHNFDSSIRGGMIAVVWTIRALSIGIGLTAAVLSLSALPVSTLLLTVAVPAIFGSTAISSSFVLHLLWNIVAVLTDDKERTLNKKSKSGLDEVNNILKTLKKKGISQGEVNKLQNLINNNKDSFDLNLFNSRFISSLRKALFDSKKFGEQDHKNIHDFINKLIKEEYSEIFSFKARIENIEKDMKRIQKEIDDFDEALKDLEQYIDLLEKLNEAIRNGTIDLPDIIKNIEKQNNKKITTKPIITLSQDFKKANIQLNLLKRQNAQLKQDDERINSTIEFIKEEINSLFETEKASLEEIKADSKKERADYQEQRKALDREKTDYEDKEQKEKERLSEILGKSVSQIDNEIDRIEKYEEIIKIFSKFYAYIQWNEYKKNHNEDVKKDKDGTEYILLSEGHKLTFEAWSDSVGWGHICDGHSILTNGNEIEGFDRYPDSGTALAAAITLEMLTDGKTVKDITENYDVKIVSGKEKKIKYIKRNKKNQKVYVYIEDSNGKLITCYVIDSKKYSDNIVDNILETIHAGGLSDKDKRNFSEYLQKNNIEILVKRDKKENIRGKSAQKYREKNYRDDIVKDFDFSKSKFIFEHTFEELEKIEYFVQDKKEKSFKKVAQTSSTVEKLEKIGKFFKKENFRYTALGVAIGVIIETFDFWRSDFIEQHNFDPSITSGMRAVVWKLRAISIGGGLLTAAAAAIIMSNPVSLLAVFPAVILTEWISHFIYNKDQIKKGDTERLLQTGNERNTISKLVKKENGEIDFDIVEKIVSRLSEKAISRNEIEEIYEGVINGSANAGRYEKEKKEIYFLFVFLNENSFDNNQNNFPDNLINAVYSSLFDSNASVDKSWDTCFKYMKERKNTSDEENANAILKMFSALYAYKTWEKFRNDNPDKVKIKDGIEYIELANGTILTFERWVHVCDGHSVFTNGIESDSWNKYYGDINVDETKYRKNAINGTVTLELLLDEVLMSSILTDPDIIFSFDDKNKSRKYVKRIDDKVYSYVVKSNDKNVKPTRTFYVKSYQQDAIDMTNVLNAEIDAWDSTASYVIIAKIDGENVISGSDNFNKQNSKYYILETETRTDMPIDLTIRRTLVFDQMDRRMSLIDKWENIVSASTKDLYGKIDADICSFLSKISEEPIDKNKLHEKITKMLEQKQYGNKKRGQIRGFIDDFNTVCDWANQYLIQEDRRQFLYYIEIFIGKLKQENSQEQQESITEQEQQESITEIVRLISGNGLNSLNALNVINELSSLTPIPISGVTSQTIQSNELEESLTSIPSSGETSSTLTDSTETETLQTSSTVEKLEKIGKFFKKENFRYTSLGVAIGVIIETFDFWRSDFIEQHNFDPSITSGMRAVVWKLKAISIGGGILTAAAATIIMSNPVSLLAVFPAVILTEWISHFIYNKDQIAKGNTERLLQRPSQTTQEPEASELKKNSENIEAIKRRIASCIDKIIADEQFIGIVNRGIDIGNNNAKQTKGNKESLTEEDQTLLIRIISDKLEDLFYDTDAYTIVTEIIKGSDGIGNGIQETIKKPAQDQTAKNQRLDLIKDSLSKSIEGFIDKRYKGTNIEFITDIPLEKIVTKQTKSLFAILDEYYISKKREDFYSQLKESKEKRNPSEDDKNKLLEECITYFTDHLCFRDLLTSEKLDTLWYKDTRGGKSPLNDVKQFNELIRSLKSLENTKVQDVIFKLFTEGESSIKREDYEEIRRYIHDQSVDEDEKKVRESQIKVINRMYAYIQFIERYQKQNPNANFSYIKSSSSIIYDGGLEITLEALLHIYEGHSVLMSGNELDELSNSPLTYSNQANRKIAIASAISQELLNKSPNPIVYTSKQGGGEELQFRFQMRIGKYVYEGWKKINDEIVTIYPVADINLTSPRISQVVYEYYEHHYKDGKNATESKVYYYIPGGEISSTNDIGAIWNQAGMEIDIASELGRNLASQVVIDLGSANLNNSFTMTWLSKALDFLGVIDFEKRQRIVNIIENPIIILGIYVPFIQNWFVRQHKGQNPEAVRKGLAGIVTTALSEAEDFVPGSGIAGLTAMLTNKNFRQALDKAHSEHNRRAAEIDVTVTKTDEKSIGLKQTVPYDKNSSKHLVFLIQKSNGDRYSVRIPQDKQTVYLASFNGDAYSRVESEYDSFEKIEELLGVKFEINTDTIDVTDVSGGNIIYYTNADEIERALSKINSRPLQLPSDDELQRVRKNTKTAETVIVYLDGSERENKAKIKDAVDNNKLLVIYPFSVSYDINSLTDYELLILYSDISRKFFDMADILFDMLPKLKDNDFLGLEFFLKEMVKNAFVHGNFSDPSKPIYVDCRKNSISVYNAVSDGRISDMEKQRRLSLSAAATLTGQHRGIARAQKYKDVMSLTQKEIVLGAQEYYVASAVMLGQPATPAEEKKTADAVKYEEADDKISSKESEALERGTERTSSESDMNAEELSRENTAGQNAEIGIASLGIPITDIVIITAKRSITPSNAAQEISIKIVNGDQSAVELEKNIANMSSNLIITDSESSAEMLRRQGFKAVTARIVYERGGSRIGQYKGMNVRAKWNKDETEILLCLKELDADVRKEELLKMLLDALSEGIQTNILYGISQVVITNEQTIDGAVEAIKNAHTDSVMKPVKETKFDLSERHMAKNIDIVCKREASATGAQAFILNSLQAQQYQEEISALRQEGFRYVVSYASSGEAGEILYDGAKIDASDIKSISGAKQFLRTLKAKALSKGAGLLLSVKFNDDIYKEFAEQNINVFNEYGIIPIVGADSQYLNAFTLGKIEAEGITEKNVEKILQNDMVVTIVVDDARILNDKKEKLKQVKTKEQKYAKGYNASLNSKFDYTAKDIKELSVLLMADINDEEENLAALWEKMPIDDMTLSQDSKSYIKYLLERKRYEEALGFVRGIAMNSAGKILIAKLAEMKISIDESKFRRVSGGMFQKALLTLLVQLLMEGEDIAALLQDDYTVYGAMTAKEYLESVMGNVNANIENIVNDNEHQIKKISDTAKAIADFKEFNLLLQDMFSEAKVIRNVKVSALAVRNILGAA